MDATILVLLAGALSKRAAGFLIREILLPVPRKAILRLEDPASADGEGLDLHLRLESAAPLVWTEAIRSHRNPDPLAETFTGRLAGRRISSFDAAPRDRLLRILLEPAGGAGVDVHVRLYGSTPRLLFADPAGDVWSYPGGGSLDRPTAAESRLPWILDPALPERAAGTARDLLASTPPDPGPTWIDLARDFARSFSGCHRRLVFEILWRARERNATVSGVLGTIRSDIEERASRPRPQLDFYQNPGALTPDGDGGAGGVAALTEGGCLSAFPLHHLEAMPDVKRATGDPLDLAARWGRMVEKQQALAILQRRRTELAAGLQEGLVRLAGKLIRESKDGERAETWRAWAQALLVHSARIPRGSAAARIPDPMDPSATLEIPLDPARSVHDAADDLFRKAGREEKSRPTRRKRLALNEALVVHLSEGADLRSPRAWRRWIEAGDGILDKHAAAKADGPDPAVGDLAKKWRAFRRRMLPLLETPAAADPVEDVLHVMLPASETGSTARAGSKTPSGRAGPARGGSGPGRRGGSPAGMNPRRYVTRDGWTVLVGRTNKENDYLTHVLAKPNDLWFHVHGAAGSHVVLRREGRKDNPSAKTVEETASIAAHYSKARHSGKVPVIYTEKRYVRKPRKGAPGLALCTREKSIMVRPADAAALKALLPAGEVGG